MGSLVDELERREASARAEAERLRGQIAELSERLAGVEERLSRLVITRETVDEVLNGSGAEASSVVVPDGAAASRSGRTSSKTGSRCCGWCQKSWHRCDSHPRPTSAQPGPCSTSACCYRDWVQLV